MSDRRGVFHKHLGVRHAYGFCPAVVSGGLSFDDFATVALVSSLGSIGVARLSSIQDTSLSTATRRLRRLRASGDIARYTSLGNDYSVTRLGSVHLERVSDMMVTDGRFVDDAIGALSQAGEAMLRTEDLVCASLLVDGPATAYGLAVRCHLRRSTVADACVKLVDEGQVAISRGKRRGWHELSLTDVGRDVGMSACDRLMRFERRQGVD